MTISDWFQGRFLFHMGTNFPVRVVFLIPVLFQSRTCTPALGWLVWYVPKEESLITFHTDLGFAFSSWTQRNSLFVLKPDTILWHPPPSSYILLLGAGIRWANARGEVLLKGWKEMPPLRGVVGKSVLDIQDGSPSHLCWSMLFQWQFAWL